MLERANASCWGERSASPPDQPPPRTPLPPVEPRTLRGPPPGPPATFRPRRSYSRRFSTISGTHSGGVLSALHARLARDPPPPPPLTLSVTTTYRGAVGQHNAPSRISLLLRRYRLGSGNATRSAGHRQVKGLTQVAEMVDSGKRLRHFRTSTVRPLQRTARQYVSGGSGRTGVRLSSGAGGSSASDLRLTCRIDGLY